jgi:hypothetical protein
MEVDEVQPMTNKEIAKVLRDTGDLLEIRGESAFRVPAYRNAARSIEFLPDDAGKLYRYRGRSALENNPRDRRFNRRHDRGAGDDGEARVL